jgi:ABC-type glycerol-3-phosphate transport system permease component
MSSIDALRMWTPRRWGIALVSGIAVAALVALPTAVIPNPIFGRAIEVTWWSYPVVILSGIFGGLLLATYIKEPGAEEIDKAAKVGGIGGFLAFFAVGCPVCNKLVLLALGTSGAMTWFAPVQPFLAVASVILMAWALRIRLRGMTSCEMPKAAADSSV